ncbi:MAG TPA: DJ-1/PfpI family protein [Anaerolineaceae bacterium]|nr:DJ-1/PfpI family protein [Anaerolineaceae bacterium]
MSRKLLHRLIVLDVVLVLCLVLAACSTSTPSPTSAPTVVPTLVPPTVIPTTVPPTATPRPIPPTTTGPKQVLIILSEQSIDMDYMLTNEVGVMIDMLTKAGFKVVTASDSGQPLGTGNTTLKPDLKIADVKIKDYVGLIDPCMARTSATSIETLMIIKNAVAQGKVIAAQYGGVDDFYTAGVLKGKQYAYDEDNSVNYPDAIYKGEGVVQDGNIITGGICPYVAKTTGKPGTTAELIQKFIDALKLQ